MIPIYEHGLESMVRYSMNVGRLRFTIDPTESVIIYTGWKSYRTVDFAWLKREIATSMIVDRHDLLEPDAVKQEELRYFAMGRDDSLRELM